MRCISCNTNLNDYESTLKSASTGQYLDMCKKCVKGLGIKLMPNKHDPDEAAPDDQHYWDWTDIDLNVEVDDESL